MIDPDLVADENASLADAHDADHDALAAHLARRGIEAEALTEAASPFLEAMKTIEPPVPCRVISLNVSRATRK